MRQGDPISPYLFVLRIERLREMISEAVCDMDLVDSMINIGSNQVYFESNGKQNERK